MKYLNRLLREKEFKMNINSFKEIKNIDKRISMITCYDFWSAKIIDKTDIDCILVGDSVGMIMHGHDSTIPVDSELIALHTRAVRKGAPSKFIVADMPFLSYRKGLVNAMESVEMLMKSGANAVKLEGVSGHEEIIKHIAQSGVPLMGHLGLTPQSVHQFGGHKVQGRAPGAKELLINEAKKLEELGAFAIVLECIPSNIAKAVTNAINIPTIGIGAGKDVDGQVLVLQDMLGTDNEFAPKFLRKYLAGEDLIKGALSNFHNDIQSNQYPAADELYQ
jgi:3-methyl-2-oxobutanoate hydroxymethyltransferase